MLSTLISERREKSCRIWSLGSPEPWSPDLYNKVTDGVTEWGGVERERMTRAKARKKAVWG